MNQILNMNYLHPIHKNNGGVIYALKNFDTIDDSFQILQLQIGDLGLVLTLEDLPKFLKVIQTVKNKCTCSDCGTKERVIKCETVYASIRIKATSSLLDNLEELIAFAIHSCQVDALLKSNDIQ